MKWIIMNNESHTLPSFFAYIVFNNFSLFNWVNKTSVFTSKNIDNSMSFNGIGYRLAHISYNCWALNWMWIWMKTWSIHEEMNEFGLPTTTDYEWIWETKHSFLRENRYFAVNVFNFVKMKTKSIIYLDLHSNTRKKKYTQTIDLASIH